MTDTIDQPLVIWALSLEGNNATRRQVTGLADALRATLGRDTIIIPIQVKKPETAVTLASNTIVTWTEKLSADDLAKIDGLPLDGPKPNIVVACRPEVAAIALSIKEAYGAKIIQIQDPNDKSSTYNFDRSQFDLIVKQAQEKVTGDNVIASTVPLHDLTPEKLAEWRADGLAKFPKYETNRATIIAIGGSDEHVTLDETDFANFGEDVAAFSQGAGDIIVLSSRRTTDAQKDAFKKATAECANVLFDPEGLSYNMALGIGSSFLFDAGSGSMGAEVLFTGMPVEHFSYRGKLNTHPQMKIWEALGVAGWCFTPPEEVGAVNEASTIAKDAASFLHLPVKKTLTAANPS